MFFVFYRRQIQPYYLYIYIRAAQGKWFKKTVYAVASVCYAVAPVCSTGSEMHEDPKGTRAPLPVDEKTAT